MHLEVERQRTYATTAGKPFDGAQRSLVFVHGAGMDQSVWALQARYFAYHGFNVFALNLPAHGPGGANGAAHAALSQGPLLTSIDEIADWLPSFFDAAGIERANLVGHSMGALATLACAARHPGRVESLSLLGAAPKMPVHPALLEAAKNDDSLAHELVSSWGHGPAGHFGGHRAPGLWMMGNALQVLARAAPQVLYNDLMACNAYEAGLEAAAAVTCPALVIAGRADRMTPAKAAAKLVEAMPNARLVVLPDCGHMMMVEQPDATLDALIAHIAASPR